MKFGKYDQCFKNSLNEKERMELGIIVLDRDKRSASEFIKKFGLSLNEVESLKYCSQWLKTIKKAEEGKLKIKLSDKGPSINF